MTNFEQDPHSNPVPVAYSNLNDKPKSGHCSKA
jgi:hypothetical protein